MCLWSVLLSYSCLIHTTVCMKLKCVSYNPLYAGDVTRLRSIACEFTNMHVIGLPGTGRRHQEFFGPCRSTRLQGFTHFEWGWAPNVSGINKSCGISLFLRCDLFPTQHLNAVYSPPFASGQRRRCEVQMCQV